MLSFIFQPIPTTKNPQGLSSLTPEEATPKAKGHTFDYNTHFLVGRRKDVGAAVLIAGWNHLPTQAEIKTALADPAYPYAQFALLNAVGFWDAEAPSTGS